MWLSLVEHYVRDVGAAGSNPVIPTTQNRLTNRVGRYFYFSQISFYILPVIITSKDNPFPALLTGRFFTLHFSGNLSFLNPFQTGWRTARKLCNSGAVRWFSSFLLRGKKCIESYRCQVRGYFFKTVCLKNSPRLPFTRFAIPQ